MEAQKIFAYSGTGNSYAAARQLAGKLGISEINHITAELVESKPSVECAVCILVFPAFAYESPVLVRKFLKNASFKAGYFAAIVTCGSNQGGALAEVKRLLKRNGQKLDFAASVKTVENYVHIFGLPEQNRIDILLAGQIKGIDAAAQKILERASTKICAFLPWYSFISILFRSITTPICRSYKITKCNGCGVCYSICPAAAIEMSGGRPRFKARKCDHCQACLQWCPQKSLSYFRIKPDSRRYRHPDVSINDLKKR